MREIRLETVDGFSDWRSGALPAELTPLEEQSRAVVGDEPAAD
jgi:hypothetical protein